MKRNAGVTIVEVATVLIIIAVTAAILFPVFAPGRDGVPHDSCTTNMKQLALGIIQYSQDYDELYPPRQARSGAHGELVSWRSIISSYARIPHLYQCPNNSAAKTPDIEHDGFYRSYAVNSTTVAKRGASAPFSDVYGGKSKINAVDSPDSTIMLVETTSAYNDFNLTAPAAFTHEFQESDRRGSLFAGHNGGSNYCFANGRLKYCKPLETLNNTGTNLWTRDGSAFSNSEKSAAQKTLQYAAKQYSSMAKQ